MVKQKSNNLGIAAFVLSLVGLVSAGWGIGIIFSILALIFSLIQRKKFQNGLNVAALVISIIGIILNIIILIFLIFALAYFTPSVVA